MKKLEDKIKDILTAKGLTIQRLAVLSKISEPTLHAIFNRDDAKLSQLQKIAESLQTPLSFFLDAAADQAGSPAQPRQAPGAAGNDQPGPGSAGRAPAPPSPEELAAQLTACQQLRMALERELELTRELVKVKEEMISLLKGSRSS